MNLFLVTLSNGFQEFDYFYLSNDGFIGDDEFRKLVIEKELGVKFDKDLWKEYKTNNPDYKMLYDVVSIEKLDNLINKNNKL